MVWMREFTDAWIGQILVRSQFGKDLSVSGIPNKKKRQCCLAEASAADRIGGSLMSDAVATLSRHAAMRITTFPLFPLNPE